MGKLLNKYLPDSISEKSIEIPSRLDAKKDTLANLTTYATTATNGEIVYATDTKRYFGIQDGSLVSFGGGGFDIDGTGTIADNQTTLAPISAFDVDGEDGFEAIVKVFVDADSDRYETFNIQGSYTGTIWNISYSSTGDSGVTFDMSASGILNYRSESYTGYVSGTIDFKVIFV